MQYQYTNDTQLQLDLTEDPASEKAVAAANYLKEKFEEQDKLADKYARSLQAGLVKQQTPEKTDPNDFIFYEGDKDKAQQSIKSSNQYAEQKAGFVAPDLGQSKPPVGPRMQEAMELRDKIYPQRIRNTGVPYFDYTQNLTIGDLFLAKQLGLNLSYIDMNVNANVKNTNAGKIKGELESLASNARQLNAGIEAYADNDLGSTANRLSRDMLKTPFIGGLWGLVASDANVNQNGYDGVNTYAVAKGLSDSGKITNMDVKNAEKLIDSKNTSTRAYYGKMSVMNQLLDEKMNAQLRTAEESGVPVSRKNYLEKEAMAKIVKGYQNSAATGELDPAVRRNRKALELLKQGDDMSITKAAWMLYYDKDLPKGF